MPAAGRRVASSLVALQVGFLQHCSLAGLSCCPGCPLALRGPTGQLICARARLTTLAAEDDISAQASGKQNHLSQPKLKTKRAFLVSLHDRYNPVRLSKSANAAFVSRESCCKLAHTWNSREIDAEGAAITHRSSDAHPCTAHAEATINPSVFAQVITVAPLVDEGRQ